MNRTIKSSLMRTAAVVLLTLGTASASAQYYMNVVQKNGSIVRYLVSNIDSVFFSVPKFEYVDLGLSVNWATCNVGAEKPDECGDYFAWGETKTKTDYSWATYKWCNGSYLTMTRYCSDSKYGNDGFTDNKTALDSEDDVAHVKWGGSWRMPTSVELNELRDSCTWTWYDSGNTEFNGVVGYKVTSNVSGYTDRFIFLPAAGTRYDTGRYFVDSAGGLWSSTATKGSPDNSCYIAFNVNNVIIYATPDRYYGFSVRPVCP